MNNQDIADNFTACPACQNIFSIEHEIKPALAQQKKEDEEVIRWLLESHYFELDYQKAELIKELVDKIEEVKEAVREHTGAFKYDDCYDDIIKIINKYK